MANQVSLQDANQIPTTMGASGTGGTSETRRFIVDDDGNLQVKVNGTVTTDNSSIVHAEDSAHTSTDDGIMPLAVRNDTLASLVGTDGDYAPFQVDKEGALYTVEKSLVDSNNSTTSTLIADAVFTGTSTDVHHYSSLVISIESSHDSATNGLSIQFSSDGTNWDLQSNYNYVASGGGISYAVPIEARFFRVVYTNGSTGQTHFRLETILHANPVLPTDGRMSDNVSPEKRGTLTKSAIIAQASGAGNFVPVQSTNGGNLKISLEEAEGLAGQKTMANSVPVVIASNQSDITVDGTVNVIEEGKTGLFNITANYGTAQGTTEVRAAPGAGTSIYITHIKFSTDTAGNYRLAQGTAGTANIWGLTYLAANGGENASLKKPIKLDANTNLNITSSINGNHTIQIVGYDE